MKKKLHIHSDNSTWAGCENMPGIFLQDKRLNDEFDITFSYRYSKEYEDGFKKWVPVEGRLVNVDDEGVFQGRKSYQMNFPSTYLYKLAKYFRPSMALGYFCLVVECIKMQTLLKRVSPDILHINNGGYPGAISCNAAAIAGGLAKVPKITYMVNSTTCDRWWERWMANSVKKSVTNFITASNHLSNSKFLWNGRRWAIIPNTIREQPIRPAEEVRKELSLLSNECMFLCVGKLEERKGFRYAIDAFEQLPFTISKPRRLVICGDGPELDYLLSRAERSRAFISIINREYGDITDFELINACDVLVVPSVGDEDFPNVILIAMMYGKPIIASKLAGIPEMATDGEGLYLVPPGNVCELYDAMKCWLEDSWNRKFTGNINKRIFEIQYSNEVVIDKYIKLWEG